MSPTDLHPGPIGRFQEALIQADYRRTTDHFVNLLKDGQRMPDLVRHSLDAAAPFLTGHRIVGLDWSQDALRRARTRIPYAVRGELTDGGLPLQSGSADAVLFVTPEYNRGVPAVLKNAIDWGTRPWGTNVWDGKLATVTGTSPGAIGTAVAQHQLRTTLTAVGALVMGQPEVYLTFKPELIDDHGNVTDEQTATFLQSYLDKLAVLARRLSVREADRQTQAA